MKLKKNFYSRDTTQVAEELIGKVLCRKLPSGVILKSVITETEAYLGINDRACHTHGGRRSARTEVMWGDAGVAYVYFIYGMHFCLNVVTRSPGVPEAVLIRGAKPVQSPAQISRWLEVEPDERKWNKILSGPGRLCKVLKIDKSLNGLSLESSDLWIEEGNDISSKEIVKTPRIGIDYTQDDEAGSHQWPLRFLMKSKSPNNGARSSLNKKLSKAKGENNEDLFGHNKNSRKNTTRKTTKDRKRPTSGNLP